MKNSILKGTLTLILVIFGFGVESKADSQGLAVGGFGALVSIMAASAYTDAGAETCAENFEHAKRCCGMWDAEIKGDGTADNTVSVEGMDKGDLLKNQLTGGSNVLACILSEKDNEGFATQVSGALGSGWATALMGVGSFMAKGEGEGIKNMCSKLEKINKSLAAINALAGAACALKATRCVRACGTEGALSGGGGAVAGACKEMGIASAGMSFAKASFNMGFAYQSRACKKKASSRSEGVNVLRIERDGHEMTFVEKDRYLHYRHVDGKLYRIGSTEELRKMSDKEIEERVASRIKPILGEIDEGHTPEVISHSTYDKAYYGQGLKLPKLRKVSSIDTAKRK